MNMQTEVPRPKWRPSVVPAREWTMSHLRKYLGGRAFTLYSHGTCVVWIGDGELGVTEANERLRAVTLQDPDFRVQRHEDGNCLVTFKGGIGGVMSGELLQANLAGLRQHAVTQGILPGERLVTHHADKESELDMIAGLYVRARLYLDVNDLEVVASAV